MEQDRECVTPLLCRENAGKCNQKPEITRMTATPAIESSEKGAAKICSPEDPKQEAQQDFVSKCIGDYGRWQFTITFLLSLVNFPCTFHIFAPTFEAAKTEFWCAPPQSLAFMSRDLWINVSHTTMINMEGKEVINPCFIKDIDYDSFNFSISEGTDILRPCTAWEYNTTEFGSTIISEWDLVCEKEQYSQIAEMAFLVGVAFGGLASGLISDKFGRKSTLFVSLVAQLLLGTAIAFTPWFSIYLALRTFLGFFSVSVVFSGFVLCMEIVGGKWLTISGVSYLFINPLGYITISGIAYYIKGWRHLQLVITLPAITFLILGWICPESPRWLLTMRKGEKALSVLEDAARFNKKDLPPNIDKLIKQAISKVEGDAPKSGIAELFRTARMRKISFGLYIIWFSVYLVYYGIVLNLSNMGGNVYLNSIISAAVELPAIAVSILFLLKMGRRWPLCITTILSGIACLLTTVIPKDENGYITLALITFGRFFITSSNAVMPVFTAEQFPTIMRNLGVGSSNAPAGIALILVPYLWNMAGMNINMPMGILGVFGIIGGASVLLLNETGGLPDEP
ncbi:organic cation transporter protein-like isoform X1 [Cimex lectularius]|uniref:Major facilitator superfamily (MFS) profile domain-containing protein n=2 Tax=Cimex lectularius TaxID=79782 RepID=A0A8I6RWE4_CIMLE|nr:organic cation transporter protein-like isoform X1 [Cimex lectularius]